MNSSRPATEARPGVDASRKKRLGQYFTGPRLARLLAALSNARTADSIIDPMGGNGDMLMACIEAGGCRGVCASVDIDPAAHECAQERLPQTASCSPTLILGNAFDTRTISRLPSSTFDLVITNPPYVRYQSLSKPHDGDIRLPSAVEVRSGLLELADVSPSLDRQDKDLFKALISGYSGLSDLAVPAWLLCAMLTKVGGRLAIVVPEAWLSRDYAQVIHYMLLRWFRIELVIEDAHAVWFPDALVKTTLLIAQRTDRRLSAFDWADEGYVAVQIDGHATDHRSIVGNIFPNDDDPDDKFAALLKRVANTRRTHVETLFSANWIPLQHKADNLKQSAKGQEWLGRLESGADGLPLEAGVNRTQGAVLPRALREWLGNATPSLSTLEQLGLGVSQGLRTGANRFFYVTARRTVDGGVVVEPDPVFGIKESCVPTECALPVLRRQSELPDGFLLDPSLLPGRTLALQDFALPEDLPTLSGDADSSAAGRYRALTGDLARLVRVAANTNVGTADEPRRIPDLSAVRTNVRTAGMPDGKTIVRYWYMLPPFARRHRPDLFVARVNSRHPKTYLNSDDRALIDANFSTLWLERSPRLDKFSVLAILNSAWAIAAMEHMGSVMGGGALKLEATHLRRLPIPTLDQSEIGRLSTLGRMIATSTRARDELYEINAIVIKALLGSNANVQDKLDELEILKRGKLEMRTRKA